MEDTEKCPERIFVRCVYSYSNAMWSVATMKVIVPRFVDLFRRRTLHTNRRISPLHCCLVCCLKDVYGVSLGTIVLKRRAASTTDLLVDRILSHHGGILGVQHRLVP